MKIISRAYSILNIRYFLFVIIACGTLIQSDTEAQNTIVSGKVSDKKTGELLPFVNVFFKGTTIGTMTDMDGTYKIETNEKVDSISFSYVGYQAQTIAIKRKNRQKVSVALLQDGMVLGEVVVTGRKKRYKDTAAITLFRNVVAHKPKNRPDGLDTYSYEDYSKIQFDLFDIKESFRNSKLMKPFEFVFENADTIEEDGKVYLPALMKETISEVYFRKSPKSKKEYLLADRLSGIDNAGLSQSLDHNFDDINIYDNLIVINGKSFAGPFANAGLLAYKYYLTDTLYEDDKTYYRLDFYGRDKQGFSFVGNAWIQDGSFAIQSVDMHIPKQTNLNFISRYVVKQTYDYFPETGIWFKVKETLSTQISLNKKKERGNVRITKTSSRKNIELNADIDDEVFKGDAIERRSMANSKPNEYWEEVRHDTLSEQENNIYVIVDSVMTTKAYKKYFWWTYLLATGHFKAGPVEFGYFYKFVSWNNIEGVRLRFGGRTNPEFSKRVNLNGYAAYGLKDKSWKYYGEAFTYLKRKNERWHAVRFRYRNEMEQLRQANDLFTHDNIILSVARTKPLERLLRVRSVSFSYEKEWYRGLQTDITFQNRKFFKIPNVFDFTRTNNEGVKEVIPEIQTTEVKLWTRISFKEQALDHKFFRYYLGTRFPIFELTYTAGIPNFFGSDYHYHRFEMFMKHRFSSPIGYTKYRVYAGRTYGSAPYPFQKIFLGNGGSLFYNKFAYDLMNEFEFVSDRYAAVWMDHHFDGLIFNRIPLIRKLKLRSVVMFKFLYGTYDDKNAALLDLPDGMSAPDKGYAEVGFGIENIFKMVRLDFLWRVTQRNKEGVPHWGVTLHFSPKF